MGNVLLHLFYLEHTLSHHITICLRHKCGYKYVESGGHALSGAGLRPLDYRVLGSKQPADGMNIRLLCVV